MQKLVACAAVLAGVSLALADDKLVEVHGAEGTEFGAAATYVGDLNDDGIPEFAVGAPDAPPLDPGPLNGYGRVTIHDGATGDVIHNFDAPHPGLNYARFVRLVGDFDHDPNGERSRNDLFVAAPGDSRYASPPGYAVVYSLDTFEELLHLVGRSNTGDFGTTVASLGDANGDGFPDIAVGEPGTYGANPGGVRVFSGVDGQYLEHLSIEDTSGGGNLGYSLTSLGDINGDGLGDYAAGAPFFTADGGVGAIQGAVGRLSFVISGPTGTITRHNVLGGSRRTSSGRIGAFAGAGLSYGTVSGTSGPALVVSGMGGGGYVQTYGLAAISYVPSKRSSGAKLELIPLAEFSGVGGPIALMPSCDGRLGMEVLVGSDERVTLLSFGERQPLEVASFQAPVGEYFTRAFGFAGDLGSSESRVPDGTADVLLGSTQGDWAFVLPLGRATPVLPTKVKQGAIFQPGAAGDGSSAAGKLKTKIAKGAASFDFTFKKLPTSGVHTLFLETSPGSGAFKSVATLDGSGGKIGLDGNGALPAALGALDFSALGGRIVELRDAGGGVVLSTVLPYVGDPPKAKSSVVFEAPPGAPFPRAGGLAKLTLVAKSGADSFKLKVSDLPKSEVLELWAETTAGSGSHAKVAELKKGKLTWKAKTFEYLEEFPTADLASLMQRSLQVRSGAGQVLLYSVAPSSPHPDLVAHRAKLSYYGASLDTFVVSGVVRNIGDADAGVVSLLARVTFTDDAQSTRTRTDGRVTNVDFPAGVRHDDLVVGEFDNPFPGEHPRVLVTLVVDPDSTGGGGAYVEWREDNNEVSAEFAWNETEQRYRRVDP